MYPGYPFIVQELISRAAKNTSCCDKYSKHVSSVLLSVISVAAVTTIGSGLVTGNYAAAGVSMLLSGAFSGWIIGSVFAAAGICGIGVYAACNHSFFKKDRIINKVVKDVRELAEQQPPVAIAIST